MNAGGAYRRNGFPDPAGNLEVPGKQRVVKVNGNQLDFCHKTSALLIIHKVFNSI